ncbi:MAG TPA: hypothetical protein VK498_07310 [Ferruginibacter sp.]|nr:hypothetical protein [Ferruginibacter sp.]
MKNTFLILVGFLLFSLTADAQKKKIKEKSKNEKIKIKVPENVNNSFKSQYTTITNDKWSKNYSGYYVVNFTNAENLQQSAEYNSQGTLVKSKLTYDINALPEVVGTALKTQYADAKVLEGYRIEMPGVAPYYKVKIATDTRQKEILISEGGVITL